MSNQNCQNGFTLMELIVGSVILGVVILGITAFGGVSKGAAHTGRSTEAALYAQQLLDALRKEVSFKPAKNLLEVAVTGGLATTYVPGASYAAKSQYPDPDGSADPDGKFDGLPDDQTVLGRMPCAGCLATSPNARRWYEVSEPIVTVDGADVKMTKVIVRVKWDE